MIGKAARRATLVVLNLTVKTKTAIALGDRLDFVSAAIQRTAVFLIRTFCGLLRCGANCNLMFTK